MLPMMPVIVGATASGKTRISVETALALRERGFPASEIVSADSMLVYSGMDIGTAKPTPEERRGVPHHLIDVADPRDAFSVERWLTLTEQSIDDIRGRGGVPVIAGGTHLYVKALLEGLFDGPAADEALRAELTAMDPGERRALLERVDPPSAARIHTNDVRRTVRALEVWKLTGEPLSARQKEWDAGNARPDATLVGLIWETDALNRRINARVKAMVEEGLVEEARGLWEREELGEQSREALGYKQLVAHFEGRCTLDEALERIKVETRRFAKNQRTWLRRLRSIPGARWIEMGTESPENAVLRILEAILPDEPTRG